MAKLNQIIAVEKGAKNRINDAITKTYHAVQKPALLAGIARTYQPKAEDGEVYPPESTKVQAKGTEMIAATATLMTELFDITLTKDVANCGAKANVVVDGTTILSSVPVSHLLFLEKQLTDLHTILAKIPTLDPSEDWHWDDASNCWATKPVQTVKTKKVPRNHVKALATPQHPEQVEVYHEDVVVGTWNTIKFSGCLPAAQLAIMLARVERLQAAVKCAREDANSIDIVDQKEGGKVFDYLFAT